MTQNDKESKEDYHGIAPISNVVKKIKKQYDKDPKNWRIISSKDKDCNTDTFITKPPNTFWLKSKQLSPYSALSMGTVLKKIDNEIDINSQKMSKEDMLNFFGMIVPIKKDQNIIASGIEKFSQIKGDYLRKIIKENDSNIGYQMARKIDDTFTKNFPQRKNLYI